MFGFTHKDHNDEPSERDLQLLTTPTLNLVLQTPEDLTDIFSYGKLLLSGRSLLVCLESMPEKQRQRAKDYLSGICYPLGYAETAITKEVMLYVPEGVGIVME